MYPRNGFPFQIGRELQTANAIPHKLFILFLSSFDRFPIVILWWWWFWLGLRFWFFISRWNSEIVFLVLIDSLLVFCLHFNLVNVVGTFAGLFINYRHFVVFMNIFAIFILFLYVIYIKLCIFGNLQKQKFYLLL